MHKHVEFKNFKYEDLKATPKGDPANGKNLIAACVGCHSIKAANVPAPMDPVAASAAYGVNPPDLSLAGALMDEKFLANFIVDPLHAGHVKKSGMPGGMADAKGAADIAAYLKSIAPKEVSPKDAYDFACGRCHEMRYAKWTQIGDVPKTKMDIKTGTDLAKLKFEENLATYKQNLAKYMGKLPPDLSIIVRARSEDFLKTFVEDPQTQLPGTAMPRVGLNKEGYELVFKRLEEVGDPSKPKREAVGPWVLGYFFIFTILAYLWYKSQWKGLK
jgi:ubiquinol-cytochrome c reductase cytochrome c1 subunit